MTIIVYVPLSVHGDPHDGRLTQDIQQVRPCMQPAVSLLRLIHDFQFATES